MHAKIVPTLKVYTQENSRLSESHYKMADVNNYIFGSGQTSAAQQGYSDPIYQRDERVQVETSGVPTDHFGNVGNSNTSPVENVENVRIIDQNYDVYSSNNYGGYGIPSETNEGKNDVAASSQYGGYGASFGRPADGKLIIDYG